MKLIARIFGRGKGKLKGKLTTIYFTCNKVGHIIARCPDREDKDAKKERKHKGRRDENDYIRSKDDKDKNFFNILEEKTDNEFESNDDEVVYFSMKEEFDEDEKTTLISYVNKSDLWVIDSGCSNHMTSDKEKYENIGPYNGGCVKFGNDIPCVIKGKGTIQLIDKITSDNVYWVEGLNYNFLSVSYLNKLC